MTHQPLKTDDRFIQEEVERRNKMPQTYDKVIEISGKKYYAYNFPRPSVTVDCVIFGINPKRYLGKDNLKVLLIKRKNPPFQNNWALPGGFVEMNEIIEHAAIRELEEETGINLRDADDRGPFGLDPWAFNFVGVFDAPERDPRGRVISHAYSSVVDINKVNPIAKDDAKDIGWFDATDNFDIAFDHGRIIKTAIEKLDSKFLAKIILGQFV